MRAHFEPIVHQENIIPVSISYTSRKLKTTPDLIRRNSGTKLVFEDAHSSQTILHLLVTTTETNICSLISDGYNV